MMAATVASTPYLDAVASLRGAATPRDQAVFAVSAGVGLVVFTAVYHRAFSSLQQRR